MVENAPKPETPIPMLLINPVVPVLRVLSQCITMLNSLTFSGNEQMELQRKFLVCTLLRDQEAFGQLVGSWELATQEISKGDGS